MNKITVYHNGKALMVDKDVAQKMNLTNGQQIQSDEHLAKIMYVNSSYMKRRFIQSLVTEKPYFDIHAERLHCDID
jgi:hypothetical protein